MYWNHPYISPLCAVTRSSPLTLTYGLYYLRPYCTRDTYNTEDWSHYSHKSEDHLWESAISGWCSCTDARLAIWPGFPWIWSFLHLAFLVLSHIIMPTAFCRRLYHSPPLLRLFACAVCSVCLFISNLNIGIFVAEAQLIPALKCSACEALVTELARSLEFESPKSKLVLVLLFHQL